MDYLDITLPSGDTINILLDRKKMKTCRIKVFPNQEVILSLPESAPDDWAKAFLESKSDWISSKLDSFKRTEGYSATKSIRNGYSIQMLGEDLTFVIKTGECDKVVQEGKKIHIYSTDVDNQEKLVSLFQKWWRRKSLDVIQQRVEQWYPIIEKYGIPKPKIYIRKMATLWGSCSAKRGVIVFNLYLIKAKIACIDYVVLHELTHFLYPNHSKQCYYFLSNYMPDWKDRKKILDQDVVHGL